MERKQRYAHAEEALSIQTRSAWKGMIIYTAVATAGVCVLHRYWPLFRRQTFAGKAFVVSSFTMAGCVIGAEHSLQEYERMQRRTINGRRRKASFYLRKAGFIGTEEEIREWLEVQDRLNAEAGLLASTPALTSPSSPSSSDSSSSSSDDDHPVLNAITSSLPSNLFSTTTTSTSTSSTSISSTPSLSSSPSSSSSLSTAHPDIPAAQHPFEPREAGQRSKGALPEFLDHSRDGGRGVDEDVKEILGKVDTE